MMDSLDNRKPKGGKNKITNKKVARSLMDSEAFSRSNGNLGHVPLTSNQMLRIILLDHSYAQPTIPAEKKTHCFPLRFLFRDDEEILALNENQPKPEGPPLKKQPSKRTQKSKSVEEAELDVVTTDPDPKICYDEAKAISYMKECEKNVNFARLYDVGEDWEDKIDKAAWTKVQRQLFSKIIQIFHCDYLSRLATTETHAEPIFRRLCVDKSAQSVREVLTQIGWNTKLVQWLHRVLVDHLSFAYLAAYLDILQTLRAKVPILVDRMVALSSWPSDATSKADAPDTCDLVNVEALNLLLKRKWDPFSASCHPSKLKKVGLSPLFLVVPAGPSNGNAFSTQRQKSLLSMLAGVGRVIFVTMNSSSANKLSIHAYCERMLNTTKSKLAEVASTNPDKQIYLFGWGSGAVVAATVAMTEEVAGVICFGFPLYGLFGSRNDVDDSFYGMKHPTLFIVGEDASSNYITDMEIFRKSLNCINGLCVVCHADSHLRIQNYHQKKMLVTQSYVDKCIIDEITWFLLNVPVLREELQSQAQAQAEEAMQLDRQKAIPSNSSSSKRKAYFRNSTPRDASAPNYITASKLLQQSNNKRKQAPNHSTSADTVPDSGKEGAGSVGSKSGAPNNFGSDITASKVRKTTKPGITPPVLKQPVSSQSNHAPYAPPGTSHKEGNTGTNLQQEISGFKDMQVSTATSSDEWAKSKDISSVTHQFGFEQSSGILSSSNNLLRYQLSKGNGVAPVNKPGVLKKDRPLPVSTGPSSILGITEHSTGSFGSHAVQMNSFNSDIIRRLSSHQAVSDVPKQDTVHEPKMQAICQQFIRHIPSLQATFQQLSTDKMGKLGAEPTNFSSDPCKSTHIIRVTPISFATVTPSTKPTIVSSILSDAPKERPLPTRCTDDSLSSIESTEGFNPELFQHLKSTLSVSKDTKLSTLNPQSSALPITTHTVTAQPKSVPEAIPVNVSDSLNHASSSIQSIATRELTPLIRSNSTCDEKTDSIFSMPDTQKPVASDATTAVLVKTDSGPITSFKGISDSNNPVVSVASVPVNDSPILSNYYKSKGLSHTGSAEPAVTSEIPKEAAVTIEIPKEAAVTSEIPKVATVTTEIPKVATVTTEIPKEATVTTEIPKEATLTTTVEVKKSADTSDLSKAPPQAEDTATKSLRPLRNISRTLLSASSVATIESSSTSLKSDLSKSRSRTEKSTRQSVTPSARSEKVSTPLPSMISKGQDITLIEQLMKEHASNAMNDSRDNTDGEKRRSIKSISESSKVEKEESVPIEQSVAPASTRQNSEKEHSSTEDGELGNTSTRRILVRKSKISTEDAECRNPPKIRKRSTGSRISKRNENHEEDVSEVSTEKPKPISRRHSRPSSSSVEILDMSSDEETPAPRVTRSQVRYPAPSSSGDSSEGSGSGKPQGSNDSSEKSSDEQEQYGPRRKSLKPIHPVSPASLSASRTRKICIPKYFAFGM